MTDFDSVAPALKAALAARGYTAPTPVQAAMMAPERRDADLLVSAQTGSGKTVAFGLALATTLLRDAERFERAGAPRALVVAPTRELALQVARELDWLFEPAAAAIATCVGGMDFGAERRVLGRGAHLVVGTPGRLVDHIRRGTLSLDAVEAVVLDEADEMLDLGFREDLEFILGAAPEGRRTLLFSATVPAAIDRLAKRYQRNAERVEAGQDRAQHSDIAYRALIAAATDQERAIFNLLRYNADQKAIVFCGTRAAVNHLAARLGNRGVPTVALSGELSQKERSHALQAMRDGRARVCVATDVAARGIDLPDLELVIHADLPRNTEALLHRSGRTGRAGRKGESVLIVPDRARRKAERLLRDAQITARWGRPPSPEEIRGRDEDRLLGDPRLGREVEPEERETVARLLERHGAERIAAAFLRAHREGLAAPEELLDTDAPRPKREEGPSDRAPRASFSDGVWLALGVGHAQRADARWLLPVLCNAGGLTKGEIGAIRIRENETFVEIAPAAVDPFLARLGAGQRLEDTIRVARLSERPKELDAGDGSERPKRATSPARAAARRDPQGAPRRGPTGDPRSEHRGEPRGGPRGPSKPRPRPRRDD